VVLPHEKLRVEPLKPELGVVVVIVIEDTAPQLTAPPQPSPVLVEVVFKAPFVLVAGATVWTDEVTTRFVRVARGERVKDSNAVDGSALEGARGGVEWGGSRGRGGSGRGVVVGTVEVVP